MDMFAIVDVKANLVTASRWLKIKKTSDASKRGIGIRVQRTKGGPAAKKQMTMGVSASAHVREIKLRTGS